MDSFYNSFYICWRDPVLSPVSSSGASSRLSPRNLKLQAHPPLLGCLRPHTAQRGTPVCTFSTTCSGNTSIQLEEKQEIKCLCVLMSFPPSSSSRNIVDDSAFAQSLFTVACRPVTYQLAETTPSPRPQVLSSGTEAGLSEQRGPVDRAGTTPLGARDKRLPERAPVDVSEDVLMNTLQNLMMEAVRGELGLTEPPRTATSPPASTRWRQTPRAHTHTHLQ